MKTTTQIAIAIIAFVGIIGFVQVGSVLGTGTSSADITSAERTVQNNLVSPGETVKITVNVTQNNSGSLFIEEEFDKAFADVTVVNADGAFSGVNDGNSGIFADWGDTKSVSFVYEVAIPSNASDGDTYTISSTSESDVNIGQTTLEVDKKTAFFAVSDLEPGDAEFNPGETVDISANVSNTGKITAEQTIKLGVNGSTVNQTTVSLDSGQDTRINFDGVELPNEEGLYDYTITSEDDEISATFDVQSSNNNQIINRNPTSTVVSPGDEVTVTLELSANESDPADLITGEFPEAFEITDSNSGKSQVVTRSDSWEVIYLSPVETDTVTITYKIPDSTAGQTFTTSGTVITQNNEIKSGTTIIDVAEGEPQFVINTSDFPEKVPQGKNLTVNATIANIGEILGSQSVQYTIDGIQNTSSELELDSGSNKELTFSVDTTELEPGEYSQSIRTDNDNVTAGLTIDYSVVTYTNSEGEVTTRGLRNAIADWRADRISTDLLRDVITAWRS